MEIRERIAKIISSEGLTASAFADMIGIQRSNVSHILNGRNGPSLELLQKILGTFPHYNTDWLLLGKGDVYKKPVQTSIFDVIGESAPEINSEVTEEQVVQEKAILPDYKPVDDGGHKENLVQPPQSVADEHSVLPLADQIVKRAAEVQQVVVLYSDNTFSIYNKQ